MHALPGSVPVQTSIQTFSFIDYQLFSQDKASLMRQFPNERGTEMDNEVITCDVIFQRDSFKII